MIIVKTPTQVMINLTELVKNALEVVLLLTVEMHHWCLPPLVPPASAPWAQTRVREVEGGLFPAPVLC